jgi:anthranilate synthase component 1
MPTIELNKNVTKTKLRVFTEQRAADMLTPVGLYLKLRDRFPGSILLESAENQEGKNAKSFIAFDRLATVNCNADDEASFDLLQNFIDSFEFNGVDKGAGIFGYISYDAIQLAEKSVKLNRKSEIPLFQFSLFRFVVEFDHLRDTLTISQYVPGSEEKRELPRDLFNGVAGTVYPFRTRGEETFDISPDDFISSVVRAKEHCARGDVFQVVLSRKFTQSFQGDEFNVYRALRMINPSPYLFFADFRDFSLFGSSPEAQLISKNGVAEIHPIAGTYRKTGDVEVDKNAAERLKSDAKENAEHIMLVDLARNDLSQFCSNVTVKEFREVHNYSHVIHLVSKVTGEVRSASVVDQLRKVSPAGTLSGAPKVRAMQIIAENEKSAREFYGGCIGNIGFDGSVNMAILIRTFMSRNNELNYRAGAGIVIDSDPESELNEVNHKLGALRAALNKAAQL